MWDLIVSVPDHCLSFTSQTIRVGVVVRIKTFKSKSVLSFQVSFLRQKTEGLCKVISKISSSSLVPGSSIVLFYVY